MIWINDNKIIIFFDLICLFGLLNSSFFEKLELNNNIFLIDNSYYIFINELNINNYPIHKIINLEKKDLFCIYSSKEITININKIEI